MDHVPFKLLLLNTITTGGDTASHVQSLVFLKNYLLPHGKIVGWSPGNYGGFPVFIYYFPLVFLIGALLSHFVPLMVAFKIVSVLGALLLPVATFVMLRLMKMKYPAPILGAIASLAILFNESHSMWGGNLLSNYAGEFTYAFSFAMTFVFLGFLYGAERSLRNILIGALLIGLVVMSHGFTFIICVLSSVYFLLKQKGFINQALFTGSVFLLGILLVGFWFFQLYFDSPFITEYNLIWTFGSLLEIFPKSLWPFQLLFLLFSGFVVFDLLTKRNRVSAEWRSIFGFSWFVLVICVIAFFSSETLKLPDIRFIPFAHFISVVFGVVSIAWFVGEGTVAVIVPFVAFFAVLLWLAQFPSQALGWARYNFQGIESTPNWQVFKQINQDIKGSYQDPRVVYEHGSINQTMGTPRAFENIPMHSGRATLEGLYFQSSMLSAPIFYLQSLYSKEISCPFPDYPCSTMNYEKAYRYLELFNVSEIIVNSKEARAAIRKLPHLYELLRSYGESGYELWKVKRKSVGYVMPLSEDAISTDWQGIRNKNYNWLRGYNEFSRYMISKPEVKLSTYSFKKVPFPRQQAKSSKECQIKNEKITEESIRFESECIGQAHLIKVSYHPGWEVVGAEGPYFSTPGMMVVYPTQSEVMLSFKNSGPYLFGKIATWTGLGVFLLVFISLVLNKKSNFNMKMSDRFETYFYRGFVSFLVIIVVVLIKQLFQPGYHRSFKYAEIAYTAREYKTAEKLFESITRKWNDEPTIDKVYYYRALSLMLDYQPERAREAFMQLYRFKDSEYQGEAHYQVGLILRNEGNCQAAIKEFNTVLVQLRDVRWSEQAKERINECRARH